MARIEADFPEKLDFLFQPKRYKIIHGGRGSGKSWGVARALLVLAMRSKVRILCTREIQKSIKDSVHRLLSDQIESLGLGAYFEVLQTEIRAKNGSQFLFAGLANTTAESIKSFEGCNIVWVEEAQTVSDRSWEILIPTIRAPGSEIWVTFNPAELSDPTYQRFVIAPPPDATVVRLNWDDNPWFPEELKKEKDYLYSVDPEAAEHVWGGQTRRMSDAQVLRGKYLVQHFEPGEYWDGPYQGADWGFASDPSTLVRVWLWERRLYVEWEAYGHGVEIDHTPALFDGIPRSREYVTRADNARPETISYMIRAGFKSMQPCQKWPGCVEDRVGYLRAFDQIIIHPRCPHTAEEARLWSFKVDRLTNDVLPQLVDKHNHCWDAIGYALEPMVLGYVRRKPAPAPTDEDMMRMSQPQAYGWLS
jgi:phage terminase large subunit